jgi:hypothetical protein
MESESFELADVDGIIGAGWSRIWTDGRIDAGVSENGKRERTSHKWASPRRSQRRRRRESEVSQRRYERKRGSEMGKRETIARDGEWACPRSRRVRIMCEAGVRASNRNVRIRYEAK